MILLFRISMRRIEWPSTSVFAELGDLAASARQQQREEAKRNFASHLKAGGNQNEKSP
jgi:hypothetical protein